MTGECVSLCVSVCEACMCVFVHPIAPVSALLLSDPTAARSHLLTSRTHTHTQYPTHTHNPTHSYYVFAWRGLDGQEVQKHARYSFVYRKDPATGKWLIVDHHSSLLPTAPKGLQPATTVVM